MVEERAVDQVARDGQGSFDSVHEEVESWQSVSSEGAGKRGEGEHMCSAYLLTPICPKGSLSHGKMIGRGDLLGLDDLLRLLHTRKKWLVRARSGLGADDWKRRDDRPEEHIR